MIKKEEKQNWGDAEYCSKKNSCFSNSKGCMPWAPGERGWDQEHRVEKRESRRARRRRVIYEGLRTVVKKGGGMIGV